MPYYSTGDTSGSIEAPIVLSQVSVSGAVFVGNIALELTATTLADYTSGSVAFPPVSAALNYWDGERWSPVSGTSGSLYMTMTSSLEQPLYVTGVMLVRDPEDPLFTSTTNMIRASTSSVLFINENSARRQLSIYNDTTAPLYVAFGSTASTGSYMAKLPPNSYYELTTTNGVYVGPVAGVWGYNTAGSASITEVTA